MNKLVIVFAILLVAASARTTTFTCGDGFQKSPNGQICEPCRDANCKNCAGDYKTCATCKTGFAIITGACVACPTGVKECCAVEKDSKALKAISCNDGYTLLGSVCVQTLENCMERDPTSFMCKTCVDGYYLNNVTGAGSNKVCTQGTITGCSKYYNEKNCQTCQPKYYRALITTDSETTYYGCNSCTSDCTCSAEADKCTGCFNPNLFLKTGSQCTACSTDAQKCSKCADKVGCTECAAFFQKVPDTSAAGQNKCVAFPENCEAIDTSKLGDTLTCTTCKDGYFLEAGACTACTTGDLNSGIKLCNAKG